MNIQTYLPGFREHYSILLGRSSLTIDRYSDTLERFQEWLISRGGAGGISVQDITQDDIEDWLKSLFFRGGLQNASRAGKLSAVKAFFKYLVYKGVLDTNPAELIPTPKFNRPLPQKFSTQQLRLIFSGPDISTPIGVRDLAILKLLYSSGPRVDEIRNLDVDHLLHGKSDFYLHYRKTKGGEDRVIHILRNPSEALMSWLAIRENHIDPENPDSARALFVSMTSNMKGARLSVRAYNEVLKKYAALVGIKNERVFVHKMRATFATDLYDEGFDILKISYIMGHRSVETTKRYIAISESALKKTAIPNRRWKELERRDDVD